MAPYIFQSLAFRPGARTKAARGWRGVNKLVEGKHHQQMSNPPVQVEVEVEDQHQQRERNDLLLVLRSCLSVMAYAIRN